MKKGLNTTLSVLTKILEVALWIGTVAGIIGIVGSIVDKEGVRKLITENGGELACSGFDVNVITNNGEINFFAVTMFFIGTVLIFILTALIFRNIHNILTTIAGKNKHTVSTSPFQKDVVRMVREIGIFSVGIPVIGVIITAITSIVSVINGNSTEVSASLDGIVIGLVCLCLTQIFAYGAKLEEEVDGLV